MPPMLLWFMYVATRGFPIREYTAFLFHFRNSSSSADFQKTTRMTTAKKKLKRCRHCRRSRSSSRNFNRNNNRSNNVLWNNGGWWNAGVNTVTKKSSAAFTFDYQLALNLVRESVSINDGAKFCVHYSSSTMNAIVTSFKLNKVYLREQLPDTVTLFKLDMILLKSFKIYI